MQPTERRHQPRRERQILDHVLHHRLGALLRAHRGAAAREAARPPSADQEIAGRDLLERQPFARVLHQMRNQRRRALDDVHRQRALHRSAGAGAPSPRSRRPRCRPRSARRGSRSSVVRPSRSVRRHLPLRAVALERRHARLAADLRTARRGAARERRRDQPRIRVALVLEIPGRDHAVRKVRRDAAHLGARSAASIPVPSLSCSACRCSSMATSAGDSATIRPPCISTSRSAPSSRLQAHASRGSRPG